MATFVLVHGAFRGGWAWARVRPLLEERGHQVWTPSLTGMGDRRHLAGPGLTAHVTLATWVEDLVSLVETHDLRDVSLVGHSLGGVVTTAAAVRLRDRLAELVHLDAAVPIDGLTAVQLNPEGVPVPSADQVDLSAWMPASGWNESADAALVAWVTERLGPTPLRPSFEPVVVPAGALDGLGVRHLFFGRTPPTYPCWATRARLDAAGTSYDVVDAGHDAPLTDPELVVDFLTRDA